MKQDDIDKIETLIGYLEYYVQLDSVPDELPCVIIEAKEWVNDLKEQL